MRLSTFLLATSAIAVSVPAAAQEGDPEAPDRARASDHVHEEVSADIVVTAPFVRSLDLLAGTVTLSGDTLVRNIRPQLGDTLSALPGVSATSFSPGASRPVLRGFQGERVRVMVDGIGSIDVSNTSADHAVTIDPITADRIEVLHGPAVLLFGGQAIGGAVNVFDRRIPRTIPDDPIHIDAVAAYGSAADERSVGAGVDVPLGGGLVVHLDGSYRVLATKSTVPVGTGTRDWASFEQRIRFIAALFRAYHLAEHLFDAPFTEEQVRVLRSGRVPPGRL
jgi:iron complex outermembrane recepter protein